jgi:hypothetical protein
MNYKLETPIYESRDTPSYSIESKNQVDISIHNLKSKLPKIFNPKKKVILYKASKAYDRIKRDTYTNNFGMGDTVRISDEHIDRIRGK